MSQRTCRGCAREYEPDRSTQVYCEGACRQRAKDRRKKERRRERGYPLGPSVSTRAPTVKPSGCISCCEPITQPRTSMRLYCGNGRCEKRPRLCQGCGIRFERWQWWEHPGSAASHCQDCYNGRARLRQRQRASRAKPPKMKTCPVCRRSSPLGRLWYCTDFCRQVGRRFGELRNFIHLAGEFRTAERWWVREWPDARWMSGPPSHPLEVWVTPDDSWLCPFCTSEMHPEPGEDGRICHCGTRAVLPRLTPTG